MQKLSSKILPLAAFALFILVFSANYFFGTPFMRSLGNGTYFSFWLLLLGAPCLYRHFRGGLTKSSLFLLFVSLALAFAQGYLDVDELWAANFFVQILSAMLLFRSLTRPFKAEESALSLMLSALGSSIAAAFTNWHLAAKGLFSPAKKLKSKQLKDLLIGLALFIVLLYLVLPVLLSINPLMSKLFSDILLQKLDINLFAYCFIVALLIAGAASSLFAAIAKEGPRKTRAKGSRISISDLSFSLAFGLLDLIYLFFVATELMSGMDAVKLSASELSLAATSSFFQLMWVTLVNFVCFSLSERFCEQKSFALKLTEYVLLAATICLLGFAAKDLFSYISAYGLTLLRYFGLFGLACFAIFAAFELWHLCGRALPGYLYPLLALALWSSCILSHPATVVARYNIERMHAGTLKSEDLVYLYKLGSEGEAELKRLPLPLQKELELRMQAQAEAYLFD